MSEAQVRAQFKAAASNYGGWHRRYAERLVELTPLAPGYRVLDAATGTGFAALAAARIVGTDGRVIGVDIAEAMIGEAQRAAANVSNVTFEVQDAARLRFADGSFDAVLCSSAIIYLSLPDALLEWRRVLRTGGVVAFSALRDDSPGTGVVFRQVAAGFGVHLDNPNAIGSETRCRALLHEAGFARVTVAEEDLPADPVDPEYAWRANVGSAAFAAVRGLPPADLERMRGAYVSALPRDDLDAPYRALFAVGRRPS